MPWRVFKIVVISAWAASVTLELFASTMIDESGTYPVIEFCTAVIGARNKLSPSWKPFEPLTTVVPIIVNGIPAHRTVCPIGLSEPNNSVAVVFPMTATRLPCVTSSFVK